MISTLSNIITGIYPTKCAALKNYINATLKVGEGNKMKESLTKAIDIFKNGNRNVNK